MDNSKGYDIIENGKQAICTWPLKGFTTLNHVYDIIGHLPEVNRYIIKDDAGKECHVHVSRFARYDEAYKKNLHRHRHQELHKMLDELAADFLSHSINNGKLLSNTTVMELVEWSYQQTINPTESVNG